MNFIQENSFEVIICKIATIIVQEERLGLSPLLLGLFFEKRFL